MKILNLAFFQLRFVCCLKAVWVFCLVLSCIPSVANAADDIVIENVRIGIDGYFQVGCQAPLEFTVRNQSGTPAVLTPQIRVVDPDGHGVITALPEREVGKEPITIRTLFRSGKIEAPIQIEFLSEEEVVFRQTFRVDNAQDVECLQQNSHLWMLDGEQPAYRSAISKFSQSEMGEIRTAYFADNIERITNSSALESVELMVINADVTVSELASKRIQDWVQRGGRLVIAVGEAVQELQASPLSAWLPLMPSETIKIQNLSSLNQFVPGSEPIRFLGSIDGAKFEPTSGNVLVSGLETPLVIRSAYGLGTVTFIGIRLDKKPLSTWESGAELAMLLAGFDSEANSRVSTKTAEAELNPTGVTDLQTQLIHALDDYPEIERPSYWVVIGWGALLLFIIGPLDYLLVHHLLGRPQLTWVTLTAWLIGMTFWTYSSSKSVNSSEGQMQQIELLDVDLTTQKVRGRSWFNFYSPASKRYEISTNVNKKLLPESTSTEFTQTSWVERPESSYRGMYRSGGFETNKPAYHLSPDQRQISDLPVRVYSTGLVGTEWEAQLPSAELVESNLVDPGNHRLKGRLKYQGTQELSQWFVAYGNFAYFPRTRAGETQAPLKPGDEFNITNARSNLLRGVLTGMTQTSIFNDGNASSKANSNREFYNPLSRDPVPILRTLSFHDVTGGTSHTQLDNQSLRSADLSPLINLRRAVLFGRLKTPLTNFSLDDEKENYVDQESVIRIILPVMVDQIDVNAPPDPTLLKIK